MAEETALVLVVDDRESTRYAISRVLAHAGYLTREAASGAEAIAALAHAPDIVLLDIKLPDISGYEVCRRIKANAATSDIPVIHLTASYADDMSKARGLEGGADAYLTQPIEPHVLMATIRSLLRLRRSRIELRDLFEKERASRVAAEESRASLEFLARASSVLSSSLDLEETFEKTATLAVPDLADWAFMDVLHGPGMVRRVAVSHRNPADAGLAKSLKRTYPLILDVPHGPLRVLGSGVEDRLRDVGEDEIDAMGLDEEHAAAFRRIAPRSLLSIPLDPSGRMIGALTLLSGRPDAYGPREVLLAEQLANRAAPALENSRLYGELSRSDRAKEEFLAVLAHELRNPLEPILTAAHVIGMPESGPETGTRARDVILRQTKQMSRLIDDLLDISRVNTGRVELRREIVDLAELVRQTVQDYRSQLDARGITLSMDLPKEPLEIRADPARIAQIVGNLLHNAAKFTPPRGGVWVTVARDAAEGRGRVTVADDGIGMQSDILPRLFRPFEQEHGSIDRIHGGLGLGLALAKGLVTLHGGSIEASSAGLGKGSRFTIALPLEKPDAVRPAASLPDTADAERRPLRILIVEDNVDAAAALRDFLELGGHVVRTEASGGNALSAAREMRPDAVVCDLGLPELDGFGVARALRSDPVTRGALLVALSGYGQAEDRARSAAAGFDVHMTKPVHPQSLERTLLAFERSGRPAPAA